MERVDRVRIGVVGSLDDLRVQSLLQVCSGRDFEPYVYTRSSEGSTSLASVVRAVGPPDASHLSTWVRMNNLSLLIWVGRDMNPRPQDVRELLCGWTSPSTRRECLHAWYLDWGSSVCKTLESNLFGLLLADSEEGVNLCVAMQKRSVLVPLYFPLAPPKAERKFLFSHCVEESVADSGTVQVFTAWKKAFKAIGPLDSLEGQPSLLLRVEGGLSRLPDNVRKLVESDRRISVTLDDPLFDSQVYLAPYKSCSSPVKVVSALSKGVHVITSNLPGVRDVGDPSCVTLLPTSSIVENIDGLTFPRVSACTETLADRLRNWYSMSGSERSNALLGTRYYLERRHALAMLRNRMNSLLKDVLIGQSNSL